MFAEAPGTLQRSDEEEEEELSMSLLSTCIVKWHQRGAEGSSRMVNPHGGEVNSSFLLLVPSLLEELGNLEERTQHQLELRIHINETLLNPP